MPSQTIAIVSPGDMGHNVGKALRSEGLRIITCLSGRSERTRLLSDQAGFEDFPSLEEMIEAADIILSIMPPAAAFGASQTVAASIKAVGKKLPYADCNATSPQTTKRIGEVISAAGASYIDGGIVGPGPGTSENPTRFYVSGRTADAMTVIQGPHIRVVNLGEEIGRASAIKMCFAAITKGTWTLYVAALLAAERLGITEDLHDELRNSRPKDYAEMERMVPRLPLDAERWIGEMNEISDTLSGTGITPDFHNGAAAIFELLAQTPIAQETRETVDKTRTLKQALAIIAKTQKDAP
ncbi:MAG: NAD(P)-dependent oxidoreductase [Rhodospirillales bacterium]|nr:NAD(P)-dependent oxidoreductase [Rhodospirillales bacterium]